MMPPSPITGSAMKAATSPRGLEASDLVHAARAEQVALSGRGLGEAAVAVGRGREGDARQVGAAALLAARVAGDRERADGAAVEARLDGERTRACR